ncbi:hypothetical protein QOT17_001741 [Balamuthia mandrillaris]
MKRAVLGGPTSTLPTTTSSYLTMDLDMPQLDARGRSKTSSSSPSPPPSFCSLAGDDLEGVMSQHLPFMLPPAGKWNSKLSLHKHKLRHLGQHLKVKHVLFLAAALFLILASLWVGLAVRSWLKGGSSKHDKEETLLEAMSWESMYANYLYELLEEGEDPDVAQEKAMEDLQRRVGVDSRKVMAGVAPGGGASRMSIAKRMLERKVRLPPKVEDRLAEAEEEKRRRRVKLSQGEKVRVVKNNSQRRRRK